MQFSKILIALTTCAMTLASPVDIAARGKSGDKCNNDSGTINCCKGIATDVKSLQALGGWAVVPISLVTAVLGGIAVAVDCAVMVDSCDNEQLCCTGDNQQSGGVNINLSCNQIL